MQNPFLFPLSQPLKPMHNFPSAEHGGGGFGGQAGQFAKFSWIKNPQKNIRSNVTLIA